MTDREVLKERFRLLLGEAAAGVRESLHRVAAASYKLGVQYKIPEAIEFFNALEDYGDGLAWIDYLPETVKVDIPVNDKCFECFYVRLCAAVCSEGALREALRLEAIEYLPDDVDIQNTEDLDALMEAADNYREMKEATE